MIVSDAHISILKIEHIQQIMFSIRWQFFKKKNTLCIQTARHNTMEEQWQGRKQGGIPESAASFVPWDRSCTFLEFHFSRSAVFSSITSSLTSHCGYACMLSLQSCPTLCSPIDIRPPYMPLEKSVWRSRSNSQKQIWNNGLVPNWESSMSRLYSFTLLI